MLLQNACSCRSPREKQLHLSGAAQAFQPSGAEDLKGRGLICMPPGASLASSQANKIRVPLEAGIEPKCQQMLNPQA
eukprot:scaffold192855_cov15-Tisochrysis_lutea.AAC.1